jgi:hypothetical protein
MSTNIFYLIITNDSSMLVTGAKPYTIPKKNVGKTLDKFTSTDYDEQDVEFRKYVRDSINEDIEISGKTTKCKNKEKNIMVIIHAVTESEKKQFEGKKGHSFQKTFKIESSVKVPIDLDIPSKKLFDEGDYKTEGEELDKCISTAIRRTEAPKKKSESDDDNRKKLYLFVPTFYRPSFFVPPFAVDPVASLFMQQRYGVRSPYASPYSSPLSSPYSSPRMSPRYNSMPPRSSYSPGHAPRVARTPRRFEGGYYEKYMKYKTKYLELKAKGI